MSTQEKQAARVYRAEGCWVRDKNGRLIADCTSNLHAKNIATALNCHDGMLAVCDEVVNWGLTPGAHDFVLMAQAEIAKARGEA